MSTLADVIARFGCAYLQRHGATVLPSQRQALAVLAGCRSTLATQMLADCGQCGAQRLVPHSCGHRACPHCQQFEGQRWIARQHQGLLDAPYFLLTFTVPAELRALVWQHQRALYKALMDCAWGTLSSFAQNDRRLRGQGGAVAVLHTHSRRLEFHPHVHLAMPAGALDADGRLWRSLRTKNGQAFLFHHQALASVFRARLLAAMRALGLEPPTAAPERWVVDCKAVGSGHKVMVYLGRYLYRGVIQERDIVRCDEHSVTYRWRDGKTGKSQRRTVAGVEFLRLVLQHVLPKGFRRARSYGLLHPNCRRGVALRGTMALRRRPCVPAGAVPATIAERPRIKCHCCGAPMRIVRRRIGSGATSPPTIAQAMTAQ
jgi:Putative transposase/Transposase zinc-binding domain/TrwC relaxase